MATTKKDKKHQRVSWVTLFTTCMILAGIALILSPLQPRLPYIALELSREHPKLEKVLSPITPDVQPATATRPGAWLTIPSIGVDAAILEGPSQEILNKEEGVWHQTGALNGNYVLAGHRFRLLPPNRSTLYNLDKVTIGDSLQLQSREGVITLYKVASISTVPENDLSILSPTTEPALTLYTCTDRKQTHRLVIRATPE